MTMGIADPMDMNWSKPWERVKNREAWSAAICVVARSPTGLRYWLVTTKSLFMLLYFQGLL